MAPAPRSGTAPAAPARNGAAREAGGTPRLPVWSSPCAAGDVAPASRAPGDPVATVWLEITVWPEIPDVVDRPEAEIGQRPRQRGARNGDGAGDGGRGITGDGVEGVRRERRPEAGGGVAVQEEVGEQRLGGFPVPGIGERVDEGHTVEGAATAGQGEAARPVAVVGPPAVEGGGSAGRVAGVGVGVERGDVRGEALAGIRPAEPVAGGGRGRIGHGKIGLVQGGAAGRQPPGGEVEAGGGAAVGGDLRGGDRPAGQVRTEAIEQRGPDAATPV